jgi:hypothetical protein
MHSFILLETTFFFSVFASKDFEYIVEKAQTWMKCFPI